MVKYRNEADTDRKHRKTPSQFSKAELRARFNGQLYTAPGNRVNCL